MDVRDHTSTSNGALDEGVKLLVSTDGQLEVTRGDTLDLQILASVPSQLQYLSCQVLQDSSRVDRRSSTNTAICLRPLLQLTMDTADRKLKPRAGRAGDGGLLPLVLLQPPWPSPFVLNDARCAALQPCPLRFVDLFFLWPRPTLSGAMVSVASRRRAPVVVLAPCGGLGGLLAPLWCGWRWSKRLGVSRAAVDVVAVVLTPSRSTSGTRFDPLSLSLDYPLCCVLLGTLAAI